MLEPAIARNASGALLRLLSVLHPQKESIVELDAAGVSTSRILTLFPVTQEDFTNERLRLLLEDAHLQNALSTTSCGNFMTLVPSWEWKVFYELLDERFSSSGYVANGRTVAFTPSNGSTLLMTLLYLQGLSRGDFHHFSGEESGTQTQRDLERKIKEVADHLVYSGHVAADILGAKREAVLR